MLVVLNTTCPSLPGWWVTQFQQTYNMEIDLKVLVKSHGCEDRSYHVYMPRASFFLQFELVEFICDSFVKVGYH